MTQPASSLLKQESTSPFTVSDILVTFGFIAGLFFLVQSGIIPLAGIFKSDQIPQSVQVLLVFVIQEFIFLLPVLLILFVRHRASFLKSFSIRAFRFWQGVRSIMKWYGIYLILAIAIGLFMQRTGIRIPGYGPGQDILPIFGQDPYTVPVMFFIVLGIAPLVEELFFRGFLFSTLLKNGNYLVATLITAGIFASIHLDFGAFFPRFILGLILNQIVMENNRSIVPSWMFHILNNGIALWVTLALAS